MNPKWFLSPFTCNFSRESEDKINACPQMCIMYSVLCTQNTIYRSPMAKLLFSFSDWYWCLCICDVILSRWSLMIGCRQISLHSPPRLRRWSSAGFMLAQRLRRWANMNPAEDQFWSLHMSSHGGRSMRKTQKTSVQVLSSAVSVISARQTPIH